MMLRLDQDAAQPVQKPDGRAVNQRESCAKENGKLLADSFFHHLLMDTNRLL